MKNRKLIMAACAAITLVGAGASVRQQMAQEKAVLHSAWWDCKTARQKLEIFEPAKSIYRGPHAQLLPAQGFGEKLDQDEAWMADLITKTEAERDQSCPKVANMDLDAPFPTSSNRHQEGH